MEIIVGAVSDKGNVKEVNQDNFLVKIYEDKLEDIGLFVICDGMGGLAYGEIASSTAVKCFKEWFEENYEVVVHNKNEEEIIFLMTNVLKEINEKIIAYGKKVEARVGTTVSALLICNGKYYIVHIGDTRIYKIDKKLRQLTEDHTLVAMNVKNNIMTKEEAKINPRKNVLTQCIGVKENIEVFKSLGKVLKNDIFILCCDGFYNKFEDTELFHEIKAIRSNIDNDTLQQAAESYVAEVKNRRETDNISIIIVAITCEESFISRIKKHIGL